MKIIDILKSPLLVSFLISTIITMISVTVVLILTDLGEIWGSYIIDATFPLPAILFILSLLIVGGVLYSPVFIILS